MQNVVSKDGIFMLAMHALYAISISCNYFTEGPCAQSRHVREAMRRHSVQTMKEARWC